MVVSVALAAIALIFSGYALANNGRETTSANTISVSGVSSSYVVPDQLVISLGIQTQGKTASDAMTTNGLIMNQTIVALKNAGLTNSELSTSSYNVQPIYVYPKNSSAIITGYQATNTITVVTNKTSMAGSYLDIAGASGVNQVNYVYFTVSDSLLSQMKGQMLADASANAQAKATSALQPLGMKTTGVQSMTVSEAGVPVNVKTDISASTPILPGQQRVTVTVQVTFLIGAK